MPKIVAGFTSVENRHLTCCYRRLGRVRYPSCQSPEILAPATQGQNATTGEKSTDKTRGQKVRGMANKQPGVSEECDGVLYQEPMRLHAEQRYPEMRSGSSKDGLTIR